MLAAILTSSDTISVLQAVKKAKNKQVYAIVLGEGLVNDALAILLFRYSLNVKTLKDEIEMVSFIHII